MATARRVRFDSTGKRGLSAWLVAWVLTGCSGGEAAVAHQPTAPPARSSAAPVVAARLTPAEIAEKALPSVVSIRSKSSLGSGFVVRSKEGWIATNLHVLAGGDTDIRVVVRGGKELPVLSVVALDADRDLVVLGVEAKDLPELALGDSSKVRTGDAVVAIGHPLGLQDTVSDGLVSAIREVDPTLTVLQISAPIAPGSSGGPLFDERGRVIGIATAVSREGQNLAFGVPSLYLAELLKRPEPVGWAEFVALRAKLAPQAPKRDIPKHAVAMLDGCGEGDLRLMVKMILGAIDVGAPLYNSGNVDGCYHIYDGAAADVERKLGLGCRGPKGALAAGRRKAASLQSPADQAWAMRDTFDGLLDVVERKLAPKP